MTPYDLEYVAKQCRGQAEELLHHAGKEWAFQGPDPSRPVLIAEAQVYAALALAYSAAAVNAANPAMAFAEKVEA